MASRYAKEQPSGFSNRIERVAIVGASGNMGRHITEHLSKTGTHTITAITRPESTSTMPDGIKIARVDYTSDTDDDTALVKALQGHQALLITIPARAEKRDPLLKLARAAAKANVSYILPNWFGHDPANDALCNDSLLAQGRDTISAEIKALGVSSYFHLVSGFWYEWSLGGGPNRYGFDFKKRSLILFDGGETPINTTTWPQSGRAIANLLRLKILPEDENDPSPTVSQFGNSPVYISSFRLTQRDMFESVKRVTGTTDADWTITHDSAEKRWKEGMDEVKKGNYDAYTKMLYSRYFFPNGDGDFETSRGLHNELLGLPVEDLDEWTRVAIRLAEKEEVPYSH